MRKFIGNIFVNAGKALLKGVKEPRIGYYQTTVFKDTLESTLVTLTVQEVKQVGNHTQVKFLKISPSLGYNIAEIRKHCNDLLPTKNIKWEDDLNGVEN